MSLSQVLPCTQFLAAFQNAQDTQLLHLATTSVAAKPPLLMGTRISLKHVQVMHAFNRRRYQQGTS